MRFIGIDPGASGGVVILDQAGKIIESYAFKKHTPSEIASILHCYAFNMGQECFGVVEQVHSMPKQGVASCFSFGANYGWWKGLLDGVKIPYREVTPTKWQTAMGCRTGGDKNVSKAAAHRLWPSHAKVLTHALADAALLAEWLRREVAKETVTEVPR